jgi:ribosomal protein S18 acetylase RimI-like enzyme
MFGFSLSWRSARSSPEEDRLEPILVHAYAIGIKKISQDDLEAVLDVYQQCEDFLALGPVATASMEMVLKDIEISQSEGGSYCGIFTAGGQMIGVVDFVPCYYQGDPQFAYISLLMIAKPYRSSGIGESVVKAIENEIKKDSRVKAILAGVQVNNPLAVKFWQRHGYRIISGPEIMSDRTTVFELRKDL